MGVAKDGMVGKKSNSVRRKSTSQINGSKDRKVDQVLLVLDGHEKDGKRKRILETLKRWKRCKKKIGAITTCKKTKQQEGILQVAGYQRCCNGGPNPDDEYVLKKALSAVRLIPRFAQIISTAKEKTDVHVHQEKERLEREHGKEEEALKAAIIREAAEQLKKQEAELRQKEREAARFALQLMESTVEFEDNLMILKELEQLSQCSPSYVVHGSNGSAVMVLRGLKTGKVVHPLEQFGLHLKKEFTAAADDDEDTYLSREIEGGEIIGR